MQAELHDKYEKGLEDVYYKHMLILLSDLAHPNTFRCLSTCMTSHLTLINVLLFP
jgi:hypothetical protein